MTLNELNKKYYFHDSVLNRIEYNSKELKLYCEFCEFLQKDYDENNYTNSDIIVVFHNASYSIADGFPIEDSSFLNQKLLDNSIIFSLESTSMEYGNLVIKAESVDMIKVQSYNL